MPQKATIRCVCSAWISVEGHGNDTVLAKRRFLIDHKPCREKLDAEVKDLSKKTFGNDCRR